MKVGWEDHPLQLFFHRAGDEAGELQCRTRRRVKMAYLLPGSAWPLGFHVESLE